MSQARHHLLAWAEEGHIADSEWMRALRLAGVLPGWEEWRRFLDRLLLWMGMALVASGLIFFLAFNWNELSRLGKLALAEAAVVGALAFVWRSGLDRPSGKAALFGASLSLGALLALIGQTYQTGADTFELFATWAAMSLPWALLGRCTALWLLWLTLVNLAIVLYFQVRPNLFGVLFATDEVLWVLFIANAVALAVWETLARLGLEWLRPRWAPRLVATACVALITTLAVDRVTGNGSDLILPLWIAALGGAWAVYRHIVKDLFVLAGGVLSVVVVMATAAAEHLGTHHAGGLLIIGLIVIGLSALGGWWLRQVAAEVAEEQQE